MNRISRVNSFIFIIPSYGPTYNLFHPKGRSDRRIRKLERICYCKISELKTENNLSFKKWGFTLLHAKYDNFGNHIGFIQMLNTIIFPSKFTYHHFDPIHPVVTIYDDGSFQQCQSLVKQLPEFNTGVKIPYHEAVTEIEKSILKLTNICLKISRPVTDNIAMKIFSEKSKVSNIDDPIILSIYNEILDDFVKIVIKFIIKKEINLMVNDLQILETCKTEGTPQLTKFLAEGDSDEIKMTARSQMISSYLDVVDWSFNEYINRLVEQNLFDNPETVHSIVASSRVKQNLTFSESNLKLNLSHNMSNLLPDFLSNLSYQESYQISLHFEEFSAMNDSICGANIQINPNNQINFNHVIGKEKSKGRQRPKPKEKEKEKEKVPDKLILAIVCIDILKFGTAGKARRVVRQIMKNWNYYITLDEKGKTLKPGYAIIGIRLDKKDENKAATSINALISQENLTSKKHSLRYCPQKKHHYFFNTVSFDENVLLCNKFLTDVKK